MTRAIHTVLFDADGVVITPPFRFIAYLESTMGLTMDDTQAFFDGPFLDCLVGRADLKESIPDRAFYQRVTEGLKVAPGEILFWDGWQAEPFETYQAFQSVGDVLHADMFASRGRFMLLVKDGYCYQVDLRALIDQASV